jgi:hypothetical protein
MTAQPPPERCFCRACVPTDLGVVCSKCGQEVRYGKRGDMVAYLHREEVDHHTILGHMMTASMYEEVRRQREEVLRYMEDSDGNVTEYTTAEFDIVKRDKDPERRNRRLAILRGEDPDYVEPIPEPEISSHPVTAADFAPRSGVRRIINLVDGKGKTRVPGWELVRLTACRGPYLGADGSVLSISDSVVLAARGPVILDDLLDECRPVAVASWRDGGFDSGYVALVKTGMIVESVNATQLTDWIKENAG